MLDYNQQTWFLNSAGGRPCVTLRLRRTSVFGREGTPVVLLVAIVVVDAACRVVVEPVDAGVVVSVVVDVACRVVVDSVMPDSSNGLSRTSAPT